MNMLTGWLAGNAMIPKDHSVDTAGIERAAKDRAERDVRDNQLAMGEAIGKAIGGQVENWRLYASRLRTNLDAHKMSESILMDALRAENENHPLATQEGFQEVFQKMLAEQYVDDEVSHENRSENEASRMNKMVNAPDRDAARKAVE